MSISLSRRRRARPGQLCSALWYSQLFQNFRIRRAKIILRNFRRGDPADIVMLEHLRHTFGNFGVKERQSYCNVGIFMDCFRKYRDDIQRNGKLLPAFANERLLLGLSRLDLPADEFPKKASCLMRRALAYHKFISVPDQGGNYISHRCFLPYFVSPKSYCR